MKTPAARPLLLVVSAPSGAGKTTLGTRLLAEFPDMVRAVTCTTRAPRPGEVDGRDYVFLSDAEFKRWVSANAFIEHARVHGASYGTPRLAVEQPLCSGRDVLLIIDVQGAERIRQLCASDGVARRHAFADVFIMPPDSTTLRQRLVTRGQDDPSTIASRLQNAGGEMARSALFKYRIVNDRLENALACLRDIVLAEKNVEREA